ncbi:PTS galactitol transporter subunit IIC [Caldisericum sp.]|jgi:PTS system galactitol-specific IIC component|uniref:PTS galactitol transporter subunit IIC n=1 Tax=Caldisericum sp. TaxID=2499687 RepID=UPI003D0C644C
MTLNQIVNALGVTVLLPVVIFIFALIFGVKVSKAFRSALLIGIGFIGINLILGYFLNNLAPAAQKMVEYTGIKLPILDVGWPAAAAIAFAGKIGLFVIPITVLVNFLMYVFHLTDTVDVDVWNYWHFAFTGGLVYAATNNLWLGMFAAAINAAIVLVLGDWTAPAVQQHYNLPDISLPHGFSAAYVPIAIPLNWILDKLHLDKIKADPESIKERWGIFGDPIIIGLFLGLIVGFLGNLKTLNNLNSWFDILKLGISMAAVMYIFPKMVSILMDGLIPISEGVRDFMMAKAGGKRKFYIGLDSAIAVGSPAAIASAMILVPIAIVLMAIVPGNKMLLATDLAVIPFMVVMTVPITRGNILKTVIIGTIIIAFGLLIGTNLSPLFTKAAIDAQFSIPSGTTQISSICDGSNPLTWLIVKLMMNPIGIVALIVGWAVFVFFYRKHRLAWEKIAGSVESEESNK